ncbi:MAG: enoyl-CoA hydratase-related protein, partial [Tistlia sp.]
KAFGAGADISEFEENRGDSARARRFAERTHGALAAVKQCRHPVLAAIRGLCVGGGLELALCADLRLAAEDARFGIPVKRLGLVVAYEEMEGLLEAVGKANALRILLEGDLFGAEEALRMGLINHLAPLADYEDQVLERAHLIAEGAPLVARWHKKFANRLLDPRPLTAEERDESFACFDSEDFRIGYRAFLAKQKPTFVGR